MSELKLEIHYFSFYIYFLGHFCLVGYHGIFLIYKMFHCSKKVRKHCFDAQKITTAPVITTLRQVSPAQPTTTGMPGAQAAAPGQNPIRWSLIPKNTFLICAIRKRIFQWSIDRPIYFDTVFRLPDYHYLPIYGGAS